MKKFRNDEGIGAVGVLVGVTAYLFLASLIMAFLLSQAYGVTTTGINLPSQNDVQVFTPDQNFSSGSFDYRTLHDEAGGSWSNVAGVGEILTSRTWFHPYAYFLIKNLQKTGAGVYDNSYSINNTVHGDYAIQLRETGSSDQNEIIVNSEGFGIPTYLYGTRTIIGWKYKQAYANANLVEYPTIRTVYADENDAHYVDFYFNDVKMFSTTELNNAEWTPFSHYYFGGVGSNTEGFVLVDFKTEGSIMKTTSSDVLSLLYSLFSTMLNIAVWNVPSGFLPTELVAILIGLPEGIFIACLAIVFIRGVG